jgi:hypothetical protein
MPKINDITTVSSPKLSDKLLGTSVGGTPSNQTNNFTLQQLKTLFDGGNPPVAPNLQSVLDAGNSATQSIFLSGTINSNNLIVSNSASTVNLYLSQRLFDKNNFQGTNGQYLTSTGNGVQWSTLSNPTPTLQQVLTAGNVSDRDIITTGNIQAANIESPVLTADSNLRLYGTLSDSSNSAGASGQVLRSTVTGTSWADLPSYSALAPLALNTITNQFSIRQANSTQSGFLSAADWINFDGKQNAGNYITALTGEATAAGPGSATITLNNLAVINKTLTGFNTLTGTVTASDSIISAFGKLQGQLQGIVAGVTYMGTWNATTNNPTLVSSVGIQGHYYVVEVAGNTNLNGVTDWKIGDWAIFNGDVWEKVDNTDAVTSVNGYIGAVNLISSDIPEGLTNLYYTNARARQALSFEAGSGAYNSTTGVITIPTNNSQLLNGSNFITLGNLSASAPLYYNNLSGAFSISQANVAADGYLSSSDYNFFASKVNPSRQINTVGPLAGGGDLSANLNLSITEAGPATDGYLNQADWNTFNSKQAYLSGTGLVKSTSGTITYITDNSSNWNTAFDNSIVSAAVTGTTTKTLTLTQEDGGTITANWTDFDTAPVTSVFGRTGAIVAESGDYTTTLVTEGTNLYYTDARARGAISVELNTGLTYTSSTGEIGIATGYSIPTDAEQGDWTTAYNNSIVSAAVTGTSTKTLTLTQQDGGTVTADWSDADTGLTSVGISMPSAFTVTNSPLTSNGTLNVIGSGTSLQYIDGTGSLQTFPTLTGYVPYIGATSNVDLGTFGVITDFVEFNTNPTSLPTVQGTMYWDADKETVDVILNGTTGSIFQDTYFFVKNQTGASIPKGTVVRANGTVGSSGRILVAPFLANGSFDSKFCLGVTTETIADGADGRVTYFGAIREIDTSAYVNGTVLYASPTVVGGFTSTEPSGPTNNIISVAIVVNSSPNNGTLFVRPTFVPSATDIAKSLNYVPASQSTTLTINGTTFDLSANRTWTVGTVTSVDMSVPTGFTIGNNPVTSSGTLVLGYASGYSLPTNASQANWDTAYTNRITSLTTTGTSGAATLTSNVLNIPQYQAQGNYITALTGEVTASGPGSANATLSNSAVTGKVLTGLNVTGSSILDTDSILVAFGKLQNQVNQLVGGLKYDGTWNAATNTPTITSGVGTDGDFYIVSVAGNTNINGITDWQVGDWIVFHTPSWQKVDNTDSVSSVFGRVGTVTAAQSDYAAFYPLISDIKDGVLTVQGTGVLSGSGTFSANQAANNTITLTHGAVSRTNTTSTQSPSFGGTFTAIDSITSSAEGHITGVNTKTVTIPNTTAPNNATITLSAGSGISGGGDFTTDQSFNETITFSHGATSTQPSVNNSGRTFIQDITLDSFGHVTGLVSATDSDSFTGTVTQVNGTGGYGGLTLSGTVTTSGNITLGGTPTGTWPISISGNAETVDGYSASTSTLGNHIVVRDGNGYIFGNYINMTDDGNPGGGASITSFITKQGDNYYRSVSPTAAANSIRGAASGSWGINITGTASGNIAKSSIGTVVGTYYNTSAGDIGGVKVRLPFNTSHGAMVSFTLRVYQSYQSFDVQFSGYLYSTINQWYEPRAIGITCSHSANVRMGRDDDGRAYVWIQGGAYTGAAVFDLVNGYSVGGNWESGWEIVRTNYTPSLALDTTVWPNINAGNIGSQSVSFANNAGFAGSASSAGYASTVQINYNNDSNGNYQMLWGSGNSIYGTGDIYCNPAADAVFAKNFQVNGNNAVAVVTNNANGAPGLIANAVYPWATYQTYIKGDYNESSYQSGSDTYYSGFNGFSFSTGFYGGNASGSSSYQAGGISGSAYGGSWFHQPNNIYAAGFGPQFQWNAYSGNGDLYIGGVLYQNQYSDIAFKENVTPIENALEKVKVIGGVEFDWNAYAKEQSGKEGRDVGVIANVVQQVYPLAVREYDREDNDKIVSHLVVDYDKLNPLALQAIKELAAIVDELKSEIEILKSK